MTVAWLALMPVSHAGEPKGATVAAPIAILHVFKDRRDSAGVISAGANGVIYGTIPLGGPDAAGLVYRVSPDGGARILHTFSGPDGIHPYGAPIEGADGAIYGTVNFGSTMNSHCGIYKITAVGTFSIEYLLPNPLDGQTFVAQVAAPAGQVYTIAGGPYCNSFTRATQPPPKGLPVFSIIAAGVTGACCDAQRAAREWSTTQEQLGEALTQLVDPQPDVHRNECNPTQPTQAIAGEHFGLATCQIAGHARCFVYRLEKTGTASIVYRFNEPLQYCRFPGPLVAADDGDLYGVMFDYSTAYLAVFRLDLSHRYQ